MSENKGVNITLEKIAVGIVVVSALVCFLAWFVYFTIEGTAWMGFKFDTWPPHYWFAFLSTLGFFAAFGGVLTPTTWTRIYNWLTNSKKRKGTRTIVMENSEKIDRVLELLGKKSKE